tara:strand:+ start:5069 stop:6091 length:1023 start_codon:yes stop_codon:yes gene_type:complete
MSGAIDNLLNQLDKEIKKDKGEIEIKLKQETIDNNKGKELLDKLDTQVNRLNKTLKQLSDEELTENQARLRAEKYLRAVNKINKQAGIEVINMNQVKKAQPRPANSNADNVRCYIRYNNEGNPYRICSDNQPREGFKKPPDQITKPISVDEFLNKVSKTYGELTAGQRREYHRLDMANRRWDDRMEQQPAQESLDSVLKEQRRLGGFIAQEQKLENELIRNQLKEEAIEIKKKFRNLVKEKNLGGAKIVGKLKDNLFKEAGLTEKKSNKFKEAGLDIDKIGKKVKVVNKKKEVKEDLKEVKNNIVETKNEIKDGKKNIQNILSKNVKVKTGTNTSELFGD